MIQFLCRWLCVIGLPYIFARGTQIHVLDVCIVIPNINDFAGCFFDIGITFGVGARNTVDARESWV
jgi:hypothetical protein